MIVYWTKKHTNSESKNFKADTNAQWRVQFGGEGKIMEEEFLRKRWILTGGWGEGKKGSQGGELVKTGVRWRKARALTWDQWAVHSVVEIPENKARKFSWVSILGCGDSFSSKWGDVSKETIVIIMLNTYSSWGVTFQIHVLNVGSPVSSFPYPSAGGTGKAGRRYVATVSRLVISYFFLPMFVKYLFGTFLVGLVRNLVSINERTFNNFYLTFYLIKNSIIY